MINNMVIIIAFLFLSLSVSGMIQEPTDSIVLNDRPVIGVLTLPSNSQDIAQQGTSYIPASYVQWIEAAGGRVIPFKVDSTLEAIKLLLNKVNGVLFTGGNSEFWKDITLTPYAKMGCDIYSLVIKANDSGKYTPLWGTAEGLQLITLCASQKNKQVITSFNGQPGYVQLSELTADASSSKIFSARKGDRVMDYLKNEKITYLQHSQGISPDKFVTFSTLSNAFKVLSTQKDLNDASFVSIIEGKNYPIYGVMFNPEKNVFEWEYPSAIPHSSNAVKAADYFAKFFVNESRKNTNAPEKTNSKALDALLIYNYQVYYLNGEYEQVYDITP